MATACRTSRVALKRARIIQVCTSIHKQDLVWWKTCKSKNHERRLFASSSAIRDSPGPGPGPAETAGPGDEQQRMKNISKQDMAEEQDKQWRLADVPIADILKFKHSHRWVNPIISHRHSLKEAIEICIEGGLSAAMVTDDKHVVGLVTSRDLLRCIHVGLKDGESEGDVLNRVVGDHVMTPLHQVIYARPDETVGMCRTLMAKLGIKCLPVLSKEGRVEGLVTARDMSQYRFTAQDKGGKKSFLTDVSERVGLGTNTSMADSPSFMQAHLALEQTPVFINIGAAQLPHPFKTQDGVGMNHRGTIDDCMLLSRFIFVLPLTNHSFIYSFIIHTPLLT
jgi:CBS domain-containing protein